MASNSLRFLDLNDVNIPVQSCDILNKTVGIRQYVAYMLDRTNSMFEWSGLPETIPQSTLELYLQIFGYAAFVEVKESWPVVSQFDIKQPDKPIINTPPGLYIFFGGIGGERDIYYRPKNFIVANPRLKNSVNCTIKYSEEDEIGADPCVIMRNDTNYMGLLPLYNRYASQMVENDISIRSAQINSRAQVGISASTSRDQESARKYLDALEAGKLATIGETAFLDGIKIANVTTQSANTIIQLIELQQYLKASWYNELGLNANFNMKREYLSRDEIATTTDVLLPLVDDMLDSRRIACELINSTFGTNISVEKSSAWNNKQQEVLSSLAESANTANIPLKEGIEEQIGGESNETEIPAEVQSTESVESEESIRSEESIESTTESEGAVPESDGKTGPDVVVVINTNHVEEVNVDVPTGTEEPEQSDSEPSVPELDS